MEDSWPKSGRYDETAGPYLHAIGILSLEYNALEDSICALIESCISDLPRLVREQILRPSSNRQRLDILKSIASAMQECSFVVAEILYLCDKFPICSENRNIALHAIGFMDCDYFHLYKYRTGSPFWQNAYSVSLDEIRNIVDEFVIYSHFCREIEKFIDTRVERLHQNSWYNLVGPINIPIKPLPPTKLLAQGFGAEERNAPILF